MDLQRLLEKTIEDHGFNALHDLTSKSNRRKLKDFILTAMDNAVKLQKGETIYHKDTTVTLPDRYEGVDG